MRSARAAPGGRSRSQRPASHLREPMRDRLVVPPEADGERLDRFLARRLELPRNQLQRWIEDGRVLLGGAPAKAAARLGTGDALEWEPPPPPLDERLTP